MIFMRSVFWIFMFCFCASSAQAQCVGGSYGSGGATIFKTTGNAGLDAAMNGEADALSSTFSVTPNLFVVDDSQSATAYAQCSANSNGRVTMGLRMMSEELWAMDQGSMAVAGIMAHEFAHIYQCTRSSAPNGRDRELQADYLAGWYLGHVKSVSGFDVRGFAKSLWKKGDYKFRNPDHHGTPAQRVDAMAAGFNSSSSSASKAFSASLTYLSGGGGSSSSSTTAVSKTCKRKVTCQHSVSCKHQTECGHRAPCLHPIACQHLMQCQHIIATRYGPRAAHQADVMHRADQAHPYDYAHPYDAMHEADAKHEYDIETYTCN